MQKLRTVITVVTQFICLCTSRHLQEDQCWVATYNGELILSPCFDDSRCRCNNTTADCSSNNGLLTYVPRLSFDVQVFNFSSNNLSHIPDGFFSNVSQVWLLDLCQNGLTSLSPRAFQELQNLTTLFLNDLQNNRLFDFPQTCDQVTGESFFPNLEQLLLNKNMISSIKDPIHSISYDTFSSFVSLESLYLYGNLMKFLPDGCFSALKKLKVLSLNNNFISVISMDTFAQETRYSLKKIDLSGNPFYCSCDIRWFKEWLSTRPKTFGNYGQEGYMCDNIPNTQVQLFRINDQACLLGHAAAALNIAVIIIVLIVFIISIVFFRYRWHLRLVMYEAFHHRGAQEGQLRHFTYDVFVGYAEEDRKWVMQELLPVVEGQWNLRACVHERDFVPGKHIVDNIADCVHDSRKILMVFSPDYARSEWCQFELKYCQCCVMDRDEVLVLVLLHETESRDMTSAMFAVMKTTTYIEWADTVDARNSFWGRLSRALDCVINP
ncbi:toll-like receptor 2 [Pomacea canaliculata]|uniref:toll-like receptor 2 n=1 Tax=Pomacea canaliculata TaxID=400727 RepID=UPI000D731D78|nr:toll-like receptor 2 [Pomacea canaliculata]